MTASLPPEPPRRGAAGVLFIVCLLAAAGGYWLDANVEAPPAAWIGMRPAAAAAIGAGAALFVIVSLRLGRLLLGRDQPRKPKRRSANVRTDA